MKVPVYSLTTGKKTKDVTLDKVVFGDKPNPSLLAQVVRVYLANQRQASARAQTRADVNRTKKKVYRQKGTGNARHGARSAPIFVGGGKAHGPKLHQHFRLNFPKKMRQKALKSALSQKVLDKQVLLVAGCSALKAPKTKTVAQFLAKINEKPVKTSLVLDQAMTNTYKSARNVPDVTCLDIRSLTAYEVLKSRQLILAVEALDTLKARFAKKTKVQKNNSTKK